MDAAGQGEFDSACLKLSMAGNSGPCCGRGRRTTEGQGDQLAEGVLSAEPTPADFSDRRRMDCVWPAAIPDRNGGAAVERQESMDLTRVIEREWRDGRPLDGVDYVLGTMSGRIAIPSRI